MRVFAASVFICMLAVALPAGENGEKHLFGFEKEELLKLGYIEKDGKIVQKKKPDRAYPLSTEATQGQWAYRSKHTDKWNGLRPGNKGTFYTRWRYGRVLRTLGWFKKAFPADWSDYPLLRMDYRTDGPSVRLRLEVEDMFLSFPATRAFEVPGNKWVTLEFDLEAASKERRLDRTRMAHLLLHVTERVDGKKVFTSLLDNIRLAKRDAPCKHQAIQGGPFVGLEPGGKACARQTRLPPLDVSKTTKAEGKVYTQSSREKPGGYPLLYVNERCVGGFGDGGIILAPASGPLVSLDAGKTWTGLAGKGKSSRITPDHRGQHRSQTMILGKDVFMSYCTSHCAGGGTRVTAKFTKAIREGDHWTTGPESVVDATARYCHDRFALCRAKSGRLWCAWSHLNRLHLKDIRAKWSLTKGETWLHAGENARVGKRGVFHYPGVPGNYEGPYLTRLGEDVACFWLRIPEGDAVWSRAEILKVKVGEVADGKVTLPVGSKKNVKVDSNVYLEKEGKVVSVLTVDTVSDETCTAIEKPGPAGKVKAGDEVSVMTWTPAEVINKGGPRMRTRNPRPHSAATDKKGVVYLGLTGGNGAKPKVLRYQAEEKKWIEDIPAGLSGKPMLSEWGHRMACLWFAGGAIHLSVKPEGGSWSPARKIAEEPEGVNTLAVPQVAPDKFLPVAWGTRTRKAVRVVAVPALEK